ncbi:MAG: DUF1801 domain-containing protein [Chloroflexota bacterium]
MTSLPTPPKNVRAVFEKYPAPIQDNLRFFRELIYSVAAETDGVGELEETLKWGQISYLTPITKSGTTIRIDGVADKPNEVAMYVHCQTTLIDGFRGRFGGHLEFEGNRCVRFDLDDDYAIEAAKECVAAALTYHRN